MDIFCYIMTRFESSSVTFKGVSSIFWDLHFSLSAKVAEQHSNSKGQKNHPTAEKGKISAFPHLSSALHLLALFSVATPTGTAKNTRLKKKSNKLKHLRFFSVMKTWGHMWEPTVAKIWPKINVTEMWSAIIKNNECTLFLVGLGGNQDVKEYLSRVWAATAVVVKGGESPLEMDMYERWSHKR